jgi:hypothetical protein
MVNIKKMQSLKQLLEIGDYTLASTTQTGVDPETGKISWDVSYKPNFTLILKKLDEVIKNIQDAEKDEHISDPILNQSLRSLKTTRKTIESRIIEKYPEFLK